MKNLIACLFVLALSCSAPEMSGDSTEQRSKFIGRWSGHESGQQETGLEKNWILERFDNGTYIIRFSLNWDGETSEVTEEGQWWIQDGKLYEKYSGSQTPDVYTFTIIDDDTIRIKIFSSPLEFANPGYEVTDTKIDSRQ